MSENFSTISQYMEKLNDFFIAPEVQTVFTGKNVASDDTAKMYLQIEDTSTLSTAMMVASGSAASNFYYRMASDSEWQKPDTIDNGRDILINSNQDISELNILPMLVPNSDLYKLCVKIDDLLAYDFSTFNQQRIPDYTAMKQVGSKYRTNYKNFKLSLQNEAEYKPLIGSVRALMNPEKSDAKASTNFFVLRRMLLLYKLAIQYKVISALNGNASVVVGILNRINDKSVNENPDAYNLANFMKDTNYTAMQYYGNMNELLALSKGFSEARRNVEVSSTQRTTNVKMEKISTRMKIMMVVLCAVALAVLVFSTTATITEHGKSFAISIQILSVSLLLAVALYAFSKKYTIEPFAVANPADTARLNNFYSAYQSASLRAVLDQEWYAAVQNYLTITIAAGIAVQSNDIYTAMSDIQKKEMRDLELYSKNLSMKNGEIQMASALSEQDNKNNVVVAWLVIGLVMIASATAALQALFGNTAFFRPIIFLTGGLIAAVFTLVVIMYMYSRTRRDPSKFYFRQPSINAYKRFD